MGWELLSYRLTEQRWKSPAVEGRPDAFPPKEMQDAMKAVLREPRSRIGAILDQRFGLSDGAPKTLEVVGDKFGLTRERVRQIVMRALANIRGELRRREKVRQQQRALGRSAKPSPGGGAD